MDVEGLVRGIAVDESEPSPFLDGRNPGERFRGDARNRFTPFSSALGEDFLGDGIGREKRTATDQVGRRRIRLSHASDGQREGDGH